MISGGSFDLYLFRCNKSAFIGVHLRFFYKVIQNNLSGSRESRRRQEAMNWERHYDIYQGNLYHEMIYLYEKQKLEVYEIISGINSERGQILCCAVS